MSLEIALLSDLTPVFVGSLRVSELKIREGFTGSGSV